MNNEEKVMYWESIRIDKGSTGEYFIYTVSGENEKLQGIYKTRARLNKMISELLGMLRVTE